MRGLDPRIHLLGKAAFHSMDRRVNPRIKSGGGDDGDLPLSRSAGGAISLTRSRTSALFDNGFTVIAWLQPRRAGIGGGAVDLHHAFLAGIGVDAGEPDRQRRVVVRPDPAQAVENRLAGLERHLIALQLPGRRHKPAPDPQSCGGPLPTLLLPTLLRPPP